jgi:ABC-2 type transport system permease protein
MSTPASAGAPPTGAAPGARTAAAGARRQAWWPLYWSVRRELWENRSITLAPLATAAFVLLGFLISLRHLADAVRAIPALEPARLHDALFRPYGIAAAMLMLCALAVGIFYCLDALHAERRDRSILFWKSLPVSDRTTVVSKILIPLVVLPVIVLVLALAVQTLMLLLSTAVLIAGGVDPQLLWPHVPLLTMAPVLVWGLIATALWYAPLYAWLLLVSAWARRMSFLWAVLPPLAVCLVEHLGFRTAHFAHFLRQRLVGVYAQAFAAGTSGEADPGPLVHPDPARLLQSPELWLGLAVAVTLLAAAVHLRRTRDPY